MLRKLEETKLPKFYFSFVVLCLRHVGLEVLDVKQGIFYTIYAASIKLYVVIYVIFEVVEFKFQRDFNGLSAVVWYVVVHILTMLKIAVIHRNRKDIGNLMRSFHEGYYKPNKNRGGEFEEQCLIKNLWKSRFQTNFYGTILLSCWLSGLCSSLTSRLTKHPEKWTVPFLPVSVVNTHSSPNFEIVYICQAIGIYYICFSVYICDCAVISIIAQTVAQLKILERYVRNYKLRNLQSLPGEKRMSVSDALHDTIKYHLNILQTVDKVEYLCSYLVLCVFLADLVLLCLDMYYASTTSVLSVEFIRHVAYILHEVVQLFMYCWWGNEMTLANEALALSIAEAYDPEDPVYSTKTLQMMLVRSQKPLFFTAGKFVPLSLDTFKGIMKGSFSYFTVLRQVNSE